jgi:hypothetical protein
MKMSSWERLYVIKNEYFSVYHDLITVNLYRRRQYVYEKNGISYKYATNEHIYNAPLIKITNIITTCTRCNDYNIIKKYDKDNVLIDISIWNEYEESFQYL